MFGFIPCLLTLSAKAVPKMDVWQKSLVYLMNSALIIPNYLFFDGFSPKRAKLFKACCQLFIHFRFQGFGTQIKIKLFGR
jgi:hypothetical protein